MASLHCMRVLSEPTAACIAAGYDQKDQEMKVIVFDFGESTFCISVLHVESGMIEVEGFGANLNVGGREIDKALVQYCIDEFNNATNAGLDYSNAEHKSKIDALIMECERAKKQLQESSETKVFF